MAIRQTRWIHSKATAKLAKQGKRRKVLSPEEGTRAVLLFSPLAPPPSPSSFLRPSPRPQGEKLKDQNTLTSVSLSPPSSPNISTRFRERPLPPIEKSAPFFPRVAPSAPIFRQEEPRSGDPVFVDDPQLRRRNFDHHDREVPFEFTTTIRVPLLLFQNGVPLSVAFGQSFAAYVTGRQITIGAYRSNNWKRRQSSNQIAYHSECNNQLPRTTSRSSSSTNNSGCGVKKVAEGRGDKMGSGDRSPSFLSPSSSSVEGAKYPTSEVRVFATGRNVLQCIRNQRRRCIPVREGGGAGGREESTHFDYHNDHEINNEMHKNSVAPMAEFFAYFFPRQGLLSHYEDHKMAIEGWGTLKEHTNRCRSLGLFANEFLVDVSGENDDGSGVNASLSLHSAAVDFFRWSEFLLPQIERSLDVDAATTESGGVGASLLPRRTYPMLNRLREVVPTIFWAQPFLRRKLVNEESGRMLPKSSESLTKMNDRNCLTPRRPMQVANLINEAGHPYWFVWKESSTNHNAKSNMRIPVINGSSGAPLNEPSTTNLPERFVPLRPHVVSVCCHSSGSLEADQTTTTTTAPTDFPQHLAAAYCVSLGLPLFASPPFKSLAGWDIRYDNSFDDVKTKGSQVSSTFPLSSSSPHSFGGSSDDDDHEESLSFSRLLGSIPEFYCPIIWSWKQQSESSSLQTNDDNNSDSTALFGSSEGGLLNEGDVNAHDREGERAGGGSTLGELPLGAHGDNRFAFILEVPRDTLRAREFIWSSFVGFWESKLRTSRPKQLASQDRISEKEHDELKSGAWSSSFSSHGEEEEKNTEAKDKAKVYQELYMAERRTPLLEESSLLPSFQAYLNALRNAGLEDSDALMPIFLSGTHLARSATMVNACEPFSSSKSTCSIGVTVKRYNTAVPGCTSASPHGNLSRFFSYFPIGCRFVPYFSLAPSDVICADEKGWQPTQLPQKSGDHHANGFFPLSLGAEITLPPPLNSREHFSSFFSRGWHSSLPRFLTFSEFGGSQKTAKTAQGSVVSARRSSSNQQQQSQSDKISLEFQGALTRKQLHNNVISLDFVCFLLESYTNFFSDLFSDLSSSIESLGAARNQAPRQRSATVVTAGSSGDGGNGRESETSSSLFTSSEERFKHIKMWLRGSCQQFHVITWCAQRLSVVRPSYSYMYSDAQRESTIGIGIGGEAIAVSRWSVPHSSVFSSSSTGRSSPHPNNFSFSEHLVRYEDLPKAAHTHLCHLVGYEAFLAPIGAPLSACTDPLAIALSTQRDFEARRARIKQQQQRFVSGSAPEKGDDWCDEHQPRHQTDRPRGSSEGEKGGTFSSPFLVLCEDHSNVSEGSLRCAATGRMLRLGSRQNGSGCSERKRWSSETRYENVGTHQHNETSAVDSGGGKDLLHWSFVMAAQRRHQIESARAALEKERQVHHPSNTPGLSRSRMPPMSLTSGYWTQLYSLFEDGGHPYLPSDELRENEEASVRPTTKSTSIGGGSRFVPKVGSTKRGIGRNLVQDGLVAAYCLRDQLNTINELLSKAHDEKVRNDNNNAEENVGRSAFARAVMTDYAVEINPSWAALSATAETPDDALLSKQPARKSTSNIVTNVTDTLTLQKIQFPLEIIIRHDLLESVAKWKREDGNESFSSSSSSFAPPSSDHTTMKNKTPSFSASATAYLPPQSHTSLAEMRTELVAVPQHIMGNPSSSQWRLTGTYIVFRGRVFVQLWAPLNYAPSRFVKK